MALCLGCAGGWRRAGSGVGAGWGMGEVDWTQSSGKGRLLRPIYGVFGGVVGGLRRRRSSEARVPDGRSFIWLGGRAPRWGFLPSLFSQACVAGDDGLVRHRSSRVIDVVTGPWDEGGGGRGRAAG